MGKNGKHLLHHKMWKYANPLCLALAVFLLSQNALAMIYVCKDPQGGMHFTNAPSLPDCKIFLTKKRSGSLPSGGWKAFSTGVYDEDITRVSRRYNIDPHLIKAIIQTESAFDHRAVSKQGAQGLMQLMPETAREMHVLNPFNPQENIDGGTRYFRRLLDTFDGDVQLSLAAYNAGPGQVLQANGIPPIPETVRYVKKVLRQYSEYKTAR